MAWRHRLSTSAASKESPSEPSPCEGIGRGCRQLQDPFPAAVQSFASWERLFLAALVVAVLLAYQPAWQGGFLWEDESHVTRPALRSWQGLYRIWFDVESTEQYYPLLYSAFWVEHKLWGDATLGYHLVNILLHATAAVMMALVLRGLAVPGALLAAAIFALHPVHVDSVAWITEQKNTLSAVFYLGAMLTYLRFDQTRKTLSYWWALGLFALGLLSKTTTVTLPAALLLVFWWQRGKLSWWRDVRPLAPFFLLAVAAGLFTRWVEYNHLGAGRAEFALSTVQRCLLGGRAICFYLGKLFWPAELILVYPRWQISPAIWWQYLFPAAVLLLLALAWGLRRRWRGPLAGLLFFIGTLCPVLGFFNVVFYTFSFVSDHFQYLPSLGIIALASAGAAMLSAGRGLWRRPVGYTLCLVLLATLGTLTWRQSRMFSDAESLYQTTIERNPACWMAYNNLGNILVAQGRLDEAIAHYQKALEIKPDHARAHNNLGAVLAGRGRLDEAIAHYRKALEIKPDYVTAHCALAAALAMQGRLDEALVHYRRSLELQPNSPLAHDGVGSVLLAQGRLDEAMPHCLRALEIEPDRAMAHNNLGTILARQGQFDEALAHYQRVLEIEPNFAAAHANAGDVLAARGQFREALGHYRTAVENQPKDPMVQRSLAWLQATCADASLRNGAEAIEHAQRANQLSGGMRPEVLDTLAAAYAEAGWFPEALATAHKAQELARRQNNRALVEALQERIARYEAGRPYRQPLSSPVSPRQNLAP